jgi:hypothetical protein
MYWNPDATPDALDLTADDLTIRSGLLPDEHPLAAARGCMYGLLFSAACWLMLGAGLWGLGALIAGLRFP